MSGLEGFLIMLGIALVAHEPWRWAGGGGGRPPPPHASSVQPARKRCCKACPSLC
jgi:hypothetical protein